MIRYFLRYRFIKSEFALAIALVMLSAVLQAQSDKKLLRQGNRQYEKEKYPDSEILYRKAADRNRESSDALFNTGDALYKQQKYGDAGRQFMENYNMNDDKKKRSASLYNLGNSLLMADNVAESIEAYKGSLKLDPDNMQTKYNLAYAQDLLKQQQEQEQQKQKQDNQNQDKEKQDKEKDNEQKEQRDDQNKDDQQQQQQQGISKEDAERILNALANDEKNVQEKVKLAKAQKEKVRVIKNW